jgi:putative restriction endonuclease
MTKCVFVIRSDSPYDDKPEIHYQFPAQYLGRAAPSEGDWILYYEPVKAGARGYHAAAKVERIVPDPTKAKHFLALIEPGSYVTFERDVPFRVGGELVERGVLNDQGAISGRAQSAVRPISDEDFNRIVGIGLPDQPEILPRTGSIVVEDQVAFDVPRDRTLVLSSRAIRDRAFRKRVLEAYDGRCALTGLKLINGGGRAEAEAAHIKSVEAHGPDIITNGIALSGTVHWMFDRGLISLTDDLEILLSSKINDRDAVNNLLNNSGRARLPENPAWRPHPRYLGWHRERFEGKTPPLPIPTSIR